MKTNIIQCNAPGGKTSALQMAIAPATRADTLAEIGKALSEVIVASGPGAVSVKLSTIRKVIGDLEALTKKEHEKADAATDSLMDGGRALQMLIEYIGTEDHPPADLVEVLQGIQDAFIDVITWSVLAYPPQQTLVPAEEFAAISEEDKPATSVMPPDEGEFPPITNEGEPESEQADHPVQERVIDEDEAWANRTDPTWVFPGQICSDAHDEPAPRCDYCGAPDHTAEECALTGNPADA
jgi:hypothetical protein